MKTALPLPELSELRSQFSYDPNEGVVRWGVRRSGVKFGDRAGRPAPDGHISIVLNRRHILAHRVAWKMHYGVDPPSVIDHINGDPADNRIVNLRPATPAQNGANRSISTRNATGVKGVSFDRQTKKYRASIRVNGSLVALGRFSSLEDAAAARRKAELDYFGNFSRRAA